MPLYQITPQKSVTKIKPAGFDNERVLQRLFETNLESLMGIRFIASEFTTGDRQRGRIDTLGDEEAITEKANKLYVGYKVFSSSLGTG